MIERTPDFEVVVYGAAEPGGSKKAFPHPQTGRSIVVDANPRAKGWKQQVAQAAGERFDGPLLDGPLVVEFAFFVSRPKGHYGTGRNAQALRPSAPRFPTVRPDLLKLARAVEDALTDVVWRDDAQIITEHLFKRYGQPRCEVRVWRADGEVLQLGAAREAVAA